MPEKRRRAKRHTTKEPEQHLPALLSASGDGETPSALCDNEAEKATLGACLMERAACRIALGMLEPADFYQMPHQIIFGGVKALHERGEPVDLITLQAYLGQQRVADFGGATYLLALQESSPTASAVRSYAAIVRRYSVWRKQKVAMLSYASRPDSERLTALISSLELGVSGDVQVVSMDELLTEEINVEWLVEPLIPLGAVTLLYADGGTGKSLFGLSLCHALATGTRNWLGRYSIRGSCGTIYVDAEAGRAGTKERLLQFDLAQGYTVPTAEVEWWQDKPEQEPRPLGLIFPGEAGSPYFDLGPGIAGVLERPIRDWQARLLVLDSLVELTPADADINNAQDARAIIGRLRRLAARTRCAILVIHHSRKWQPGMPAAGGRHLGSVALVNTSDSALEMLRAPDETRLVMHTKARLSKHAEPTFRLATAANERGEGLILLHDGVFQEDAGAGVDRAEEAMLEQLATGPTLRTDLLAIAREVGGVRPRQAGEALSRLKKDGKVGRRQVGHQAEYRLVES